MVNLTDTQRLVQSFYKDEKGEPILLTPGQDELFTAIAKKTHPRLHFMHHTRYGKSMTTGLAVLTRATTYPEKWGILAGTRDKAKVIMDHVISHIFDNDYTRERFMPEKGESVSDIRRYKNKSRLTFIMDKKGVDPVTGKEITLYSEVFIGTAKEALGFGAPNIVLDEASLIEDNDFSLVLRMLGDNPYENFMVKIGNPFNRNHFLDSWHDPHYKKYVVDCYRSLEEGRITQETIDENKKYSFFKILYECMFPSASEVDESGWMYLLKDEDVKSAVNRWDGKLSPVGVPRLGVDVARGGRNFNCWVLRYDNYAEVLLKNRDDDLMSVADTTVNFMRDIGISEDEVYVDDTGVGGGVTDYLKRHKILINPIKLGESAIDEPDQKNIRSQCYAGKDGLEPWVKGGGALKPHEDWQELVDIRYKKNIGKQTIIEPKEDMRKRGKDSPDTADAFALTFAKTKRAKYHGIDVQKVLESGASSPYGGVKPYPNMPG